jgi:D-amino-acid dehydrogenase
VTTVVLGAGVIGVATAYYLARDGHRVVVVDRQPAAGLETSFANGALVTPGMSDPWAAPGVPAMILTHLGREDSPILLRLKALPGMLGWGLRFLANCAPGRWRENTETVFRLGIYSRDALDALTEAMQLSYDRSERGNLRVYQDRAALAQAAKAAEMYRGLGLPVAVLDTKACIGLEPALRPVQHELAGGVHYVGDRSGDCLRFTQSLALHAASLGVEFRYDTAVTGFEAAGGRVEAVTTTKGRVAGERFVLACGSYSTPLARQLGLRLPVRPVKGYSATLPVGGWNNAPTMPVVDYHRKIAVTRLGDRIRLAGTAEFAGYDTTANPRRAAMLLAAFGALFPEYPKSGEAQHWQGLRPMCPDGRPILGPSPLPNLFLNTGHGPLGWSLACGSAKALTDLLAGRRPEIDLGGFALDRF